MSELQIKCLACGSEDFVISSGYGHVSITCDGCGATSEGTTKCSICASEEKTKQDIRPERIHEKIHEVAPKGSVYFISAVERDAPVKIGLSIPRQSAFDCNPFVKAIRAHLKAIKPFANVDGLDLRKPRPHWKLPGLGLRSL